MPNQRNILNFFSIQCSGVMTFDPDHTTFSCHPGITRTLSPGYYIGELCNQVELDAPFAIPVIVTVLTSSQFIVTGSNLIL